MTLDTLRDEALDLHEETVALRRSIHERPELGNDLPITRDLVLESLEGLPLDISLHETTSGISALLTGGQPGPTVLLRGDMDALPLDEDTGLDFSSKTDGCMHACGHDTHTAMLSSAAKILSAHQDEIPGRVLFMFQPGEEGHHGAKYMLEEGLLDLPAAPDGSASPVTGAFALHITSSLPTGAVATRGGACMASADEFVIRVHGSGGHASEPFRTVDPIPIACEIVQALQLMVTRRVDVFDPAVVTVGRIQAGTTNNIIPPTAEIQGTIRTVSAGTRAKVHDNLRRVAERIAEAHGASAEPEILHGYPVTSNDDRFADFTLDTARDVLGADRVHRLPNPIMGAEDFSYVLEEVPGTMMFLGGTPHERDPGTAPANHSNLVTFDEAAMPTGVELYSQMALRHLGVGA
ncbi:MAG: M20 family metallopeptidase [Ilumatobacter sp.]|uniref:M20 metallopeptidase family protein n=1 Tax=Ilumatobacter sp. TaxID=1967498 RepID=UPI00260463ED|nr:M20 family metallopeptidase [Ilumatobacter sp.]MDJ0769046.1 M20 family metallopeptidase [Ilumatobacter sp.]